MESLGLIKAFKYTYDEETASEIIQGIREEYFQLFLNMKNKLEEEIK